MSNVLNHAVLGLGSASGPRLTDRGQCAAMDTSTTSLPTGASTVTADGYAAKNGDKILYTALTTGANQLYAVTGLGTPSGAQFQAQMLGAATMPSLGDCLSVKAGSSNGLTTVAWAAGSWQAISVSVGA